MGNTNLAIVVGKDVRDSAEYLNSKGLLIEKIENQARLREIDKLLRDMRILQPDQLKLAMDDTGYMREQQRRGK